MKRCLCLLLVTVSFLFLLSGCKEEVSVNTLQGNGLFMVGYGKTDISPSEYVFLRRHSAREDSRTSTGVDEPLYAICISITDKDNNTVLLLTVDLFGAEDDIGDTIRQSVSQRTGVPFDNIIYHCTHNLSGPDPADEAYRKLLISGCVQAAETAMADCKSAQMYTAFSRPAEMVYTSHYLMNDGSIFGGNPGKLATSYIIGHSGVADNLLQMVKFVRNGDKDVILVNWQGHPDMPEDDYFPVATGGFQSVMRATIEEKLDCEAVYIQGGGGNLSCGSLLSEDTWDYKEYGKKLGEIAIDTADDFHATEMGPILLSKKFLNELGEVGEEGTPVYTYAIGNLALVAVPFEVFDANAIPVREESDFKMTVFAACSNAYHGYLPNPEAFMYHSVEVNETKYPMGTAENLQFLLRDMLEELFEQSGNKVRQKGEGYITPEFKARSDGYVYTNPQPGELSEYELVENGLCRIELMVGTERKTMLVRDEELAKDILERITMKLKFDASNVIVQVES